jgi:hypothetical protein
MGKSKSNLPKKKNAWMAHVEAVKQSNPGLSLMELLKKAKTSYKKEKHGGSLVVLPMLGGKGQSGGSAPSALTPDSVSGGGSSSGTALQLTATQFSGGKKSKRRSGSKRSGSKRKRRGSKRH